MIDFRQHHIRAFTGSDFRLHFLAMNETPDSPTDPRIYMAAERTFLAWIRTGIAFMGFGFVVARFGLFYVRLHIVTM
jgi:uncharacterized membrane protein YidH (DUF202 family)